jgi:hypothetical protein
MANTGFVSWSQTAASNSTADATVNWAEGQAPSSVNDSARAMMAAMAKWRDDNNGSLVTTGTSTAYTVSTNQSIDTLSSGLTLRVKLHATNGASPTLEVNVLGAKPIHILAGTAVATGYISANAICTFIYNGTAWVMIDAAWQFFQAGTVMLFRQTAAPGGWTKDTSNYDNHAIRVVNGTASSGGSVGFTTAFSSFNIAQNQLPNVVPTASGTQSPSATTASGTARATSSGTAASNIGTNGGGTNISGFATNQYEDITISSVNFANATISSINGGVSQQPLNLAVQYVDVIFATKA